MNNDTHLHIRPDHFDTLIHTYCSDTHSWTKTAHLNMYTDHFDTHTFTITHILRKHISLSYSHVLTDHFTDHFYTHTNALNTLFWHTHRSTKRHIYTCTPSISTRTHMHNHKHSSNPHKPKHWGTCTDAHRSFRHIHTQNHTTLRTFTLLNPELRIQEIWTYMFAQIILALTHTCTKTTWTL